MSDFERWFLLIYTVYTAAAVALLMWVGRHEEEEGGLESFRRRLKKYPGGQK